MPNQTQIGSAGSAIDGGAALQEATARRAENTPSPLLNQQSATAPGGAAVQPPQPSGDATLVNSQSVPGSASPPQFSTSESELIIKSLGQRLSSISTIQKSQLGPQEAPVGGGGNRV